MRKRKPFRKPYFGEWNWNPKLTPESKITCLWVKILRKIRKSPDYHRSLARKLHVDNQTLWNELKRLVEDGLLRRHKPEYQSRPIFYHLTEKGKQYMDEMKI